MSQITKQYTFISGTKADPTQVNADFDALYTQSNSQDIQVSNLLGITANIWVNVKDPKYGAKGDGVTDDTAAIQAAIDTGVDVFFPDGTYLIKNTTSKKGLKPKSNTRLYGAGNAILKLGSSVCNIFSNFIDDFSTAGYATLTNVIIENLIFDGDYYNLTDPGTLIVNGDNYGFGVYLVHATNIQVVNCRFYRHWYGGSDLFVVDRPLFDNCYFEDCCNKANFFGVKYAAFGADGSTHGKIKDNHVYNCYGGFRVNSGINNGVVATSYSWDIYGNLFDGTIDGVQIYGGVYEDVNVHHNRFINIGYRAIAVSGGGTSYNRSSQVKKLAFDNNIIVSNQAIPASQAIIYASAVDSISITNNTIEVTTSSAGSDIIVCGSEYNGSVQVYPSRCIISNNTIKCIDIRYVFNIQGKYKVVDNFVSSGATTYLMFGNANTDFYVENNNFTVVSGGVWNRIYNSAIWRGNTGYRTINFGTASVASGGTVAHGISGIAPTFASAQVVGDFGYTIGISIDATNLTIFIFNNTGVHVTSAVNIMWSAVHPDYYQYT